MAAVIGSAAFVDAPAKKDVAAAEQETPQAAQASACTLALLEQFLQTSLGASRCNKAGFVPLADVLSASPTLRALTQGSVKALAAAAAGSPADGAVELDVAHAAVRYRGQLERVRLAAERHVATGCILSLADLLKSRPVAARLSALPEAERPQVLQQALRGSATVVVRGQWVMPLDVQRLPGAPKTSALSADACVFQPSWQRAQVKAKSVDAELAGCGEKTVTTPSALGPDGAVATPSRSVLSEPDSEPEVAGSPKDSPPMRLAADGTPEHGSVVGSPEVPPLPGSDDRSRALAAPSTPPAPEAAAPETKGVAVPAAPPTPTSWAAQQRMRRLAASQSGDGVAREIKSILNKLTVEKFAQLSQKLLAIEFRTKDHMELLIQEVFEKATTQHPFIEMYADLCIILHEFFAGHPIAEDPKFTFKRVLLNQCQVAFERNLAPPAVMADLDPEDRIIEETKYKTRMVGNIRLVGELLVRKLIPSKVMLAILDELLSGPTPEALEAAAVLLTVVGPTFDTHESSLRPVFTGLFSRVKHLAASDACESRARCLLKDVIELRDGGWRSERPKRQERPTTLQAVHEKAAAEGAAAPPAGGARLRA